MIRSLAILLILGLVACASTTPNVVPAQFPQPTTALPMVEVADLEARALLLLLADRKMWEPYVITESVEGSPSLRRELARSLGRIGDRRSRSWLEDLVIDDDLEVQRQAVFSLGVLGDAAAARSLLRATASADEVKGHRAVAALADLDIPLFVVVAAMESLGEESRWARLLPSLYRFDEEASRSVALSSYGERQGEEKEWAAYALEHFEDPNFLEAYRDMIQSSSVVLRRLGAKALGATGEAEDLPALRSLIEGEDPLGTIASLKATESLVRRGRAAAPTSWIPTLVNLFSSVHGGVRDTALEVSSVWLKDETLKEALGQRVVGTNRQDRELALLSLARVPYPQVFDALAEEEGALDSSRRQFAARLAQAIKEVDVLRRLLTDPVARVRSQALEGILDVSGREAGAFYVASALEDDDFGVRATALEWLVGEPVADLDTLDKAFQQAHRDRSSDGRLAVIRALVARAQIQPLEKGGILLLLDRLTEHPDFLVRRKVAEALLILDPENQSAIGTVATDRSSDFYRNIVQQTRTARFLEVQTDRGRLLLAIDCPEVPMACHSLFQWSNQGFYDGLAFHRVIPGFVVQTGDSRGDGRGDGGWTLRDEINPRPFERGTVGLALSEPDTGSSQFFITTSRQPHLDRRYPAVGQVIEGLEVLDGLRRNDRIVKMREFVDPGIQ